MVTSNEAGEAAYDKTIISPTPLDPAAAAERLKEVKGIFDQLGVVFFLGSGTCLGAIRENRFIPWDDEMDTASVIGLHGLTEGTIDRVIDAFTENGYYVHVGRSSRCVDIGVVKSSIRADWTCHRIIDDSIYEYPAVKSPVRLFTQLKEIDFIGEKFLVPNPPEEYLRIKYGPDWRTPKGPGFEKDVVQKIPDAAILNHNRRLRQFLTKHIAPWRAGRIRVFDREGEPVNGAEVVVVGVGRSRTNKQGYARFYVPDEYFYAVIVTYDDHEEVLYEEVLTPGATYVYRPGPKITAEQHYKAGVRAMALSRE
ncbi:MAG: LicD family protein [Chloroflexi bacterium]|nr:LicD family protein [Chloroflexota bacterium]